MEENNSIKIILDIFKTLFILKSKLVGDTKIHVTSHDLNRSEVMALLHIHSRQKITMGKLCGDMDLKSGSLTTVIDNLVEKGYVKRDYDPRDRRKVIVTVTGKGTEIAQKLCKYIENNAIAEVLKKISNRLGA